jgi:hypothetical protein
VLRPCCDLAASGGTESKLGRSNIFETFCILHKRASLGW